MTNENYNIDNQFLKAINELKELLEKDKFQKLTEIINYTRNNPILAAVSYFFINDKIAELKNAEEKINMKRDQLEREINELKDNKRKVENEIKTQINAFNLMKANIIEEKDNLARIAEKLNETKEKVDAKEQRLSYATNFLKQQENKLQQWQDNLTYKA